MDHELLFVLEAHQKKYPILGICFGHQIIARALGGMTEKAKQGWGAGVQSFRKTVTKSWLNPDLDKFSLLVFYQDQVTRLPKGAELIAESEFCPIASFRIANHILTFQGHPEFEKSYTKSLLELREKILGPEIFSWAINSLEESVQSDVVTQWIIKFLRKNISY